MNASQNFENTLGYILYMLYIIFSSMAFGNGYVYVVLSYLLLLPCEDILYNNYCF